MHFIGSALGLLLSEPTHDHRGGAVRSVEEIARDARDAMPFSNSTEWESWSAHWCDRCKVDAPARVRGDYANGCPLILIALGGKTPVEWFEQPGITLDRYHCVEFRDEDEPNCNPHPERPMPGQGELVPRTDYERPKVFADIAAEIKRVDR